MRRLGVSKQPSSVDILDCQSLYGVVESIKELLGQSAPLNYGALLEYLAEIRATLGFRPAETCLAVAAIDELSEAQGRFVQALQRLGIVVHRINWRQALNAPPPGTAGERVPLGSSLAPQIAYVLGLLASRENPEVLVVSSNFHLYHPLIDFVQERRGKAALVFFEQFLDHRWEAVRPWEKSGLKFVGLDSASPKLLGVDLTSSGGGDRATPDGLAAL
jgi:hypothetical protein